MSKELQFLIYNTPQEDIKVDVVMKDETIWLTQKAMGELFGVERSVITKHLARKIHQWNIFLIYRIFLSGNRIILGFIFKFRL